MEYFCNYFGFKDYPSSPMDIHQLLEMGKCSIKRIGCIRYSQLGIFLVGKKIWEIGREAPIRRP